MEIETDLRLTSDRLLRTLEQLEALENEKRSAAPGSARFKRLAIEIERLAAALFSHTYVQQQLADKSLEIAAKTGETLTPIAEVTETRDLQLVLSEWRDAERRLSGAKHGTAERSQAAADVNRLRDEYHRTYSAQSRSSRSKGG